MSEVTRSALAIGDAVEVEKIEIELVDGPRGWEECAKTRQVWVPATVCGVDPLTVAFASHQKWALHPGIAVRRASK